MTRSGPSEHEFRVLLRKARVGDETAWMDLYRWLAPQVLGFLRSGRAPDAEDVLGEVWLDVARGLGRFKGDVSGFRAWVFTIARSRRIDQIRKRVRRREEPVDPTQHHVIASLQDVEAEALTLVEVADLMSLFDALTDDQVEVLVLRTIVGMSAAEVAEITGRSTGAVEQLQHRALIRIRGVLTERKETSLTDGDIP